jgi:cell division protease FtsH
MSERLGHVALEKDGRSFLSPNPLADGARDRSYSDETASAIDDEVRGIVDTVFERTVALLRERRDTLDRTAQRLLEKETLDEAELAQLTALDADAQAADGRTAVELERETGSQAEAGGEGVALHS